MKIQFPTILVADLSTAHITKADGQLLAEATKDTPLVCGVDPRGYGTWLYVPTPEVWRDYDFRSKCLAAGYSHDFCNLLQQVSAAGYLYLCLDRDGEVVDGLPQFDW